MRGEGRHIYFTRPTLDRLEKYLAENFGTHRALSMVVQKAVEEYLTKVGAGLKHTEPQNNNRGQE